MNKAAIVAKILTGLTKKPKYVQGNAFAPANIALCKYWGKRNSELNLPITGSLSISLGTLGAKTTVELEDNLTDSVFLNGEKTQPD